MRLLFSTADLKIGGNPIEGFPLLIDDDCAPLQPAQNFLLHALLGGASTRNKSTWEAAGRRLYDYFAFLSANELRWDQTDASMGVSPLSRYRDWSAGELQLSATTINKRLGLVIRFYEWACLSGHIDNVPFSSQPVRVDRQHSVLTYVKRRKPTFEHAPVLLKENRSPIKFLTRDQIQVCRDHLLNPSHRLLFELMLRSGLKSCEARTFPAKYVFDPAGRQDLRAGQVIRVDLNPRDLAIKLERPRSVDVPWDLMRALNAYKNRERELLKSHGAAASDALVLSSFGAEMARTSVVGLFGDLTKKVGFPVSALMLRHSYATYTLAALRRRADFQGEPLLYVRERLGHANVQTSAQYLDVVKQLETQPALQHDEFMDGIFAAGGLP